MWLVETTPSRTPIQVRADRVLAVQGCPELGYSSLVLDGAAEPVIVEGDAADLAERIEQALDALSAGRLGGS